MAYFGNIIAHCLDRQYQDVKISDINLGVNKHYTVRKITGFME